MMATLDEEKNRQPGARRQTPGIVAPSVQGAPAAAPPGSVASIAARSFSDGSDGKSATPGILSRIGSNLATQARGFGNAAASLTVGPIDDLGRAGLALVTGNDPTTRPGGTFASTNRFLAGSKQAERDLLGGQTAGQAIQQAGAAVTGTQPLGGPAPATKAPAAASPQTAGAPLLSAQNAASPVAPVPVPVAQPAVADGQTSIYRSNQNGAPTFSDQPSADAQPYTPGANPNQGLGRFLPSQRVDAGVPVGSEDANAGIQSFLKQSAQDHATARAQQAQDFASSTATENAISQRNQDTELARRARQAARSLRLVPGGRTQRQLLGEAAGFDTAAAEAQGRVGTDPRFITTPEQQANITDKQELTNQRGALNAQQVLAAQLGNQSQQDDQALLAKYAGAKPADQQAIVRELMLRGGKDPNTDAFKPLTVGGGVNELGLPQPQSLAVVNQRTGETQFINGQGQQAAPRAGEVQGGYRFKGGDPADQKNWEKV